MYKDLPSKLANRVYDRLANNSDGFNPNEAVDMWLDCDTKEIYMTIPDQDQLRDRFFKFQLVEMELDENDNLIEIKGEN